MIDIKIKKRLGNFDIDVAFSVPSKGITVLAGPSGSGKTSIINMIAGLLKPDTGRISTESTIFFDSEKKINCPINKRRCGYVFQDDRLFPNMSVRKNLLYGCPDKKNSELDAVLNLLGIDHLLDRMPSKLSGGEKQRVSIGRALIMKPDILLMDEPLVSLDIERRDELITYIDKLPDKFSIPIFYVTHSPQEILRLNDKLIQIHNGKVKNLGMTREYLGIGNDGREEHVSIFKCTTLKYDPSSKIILAQFPGGNIFITSDKKPQVNFHVAINASDVSISLEKPKNISISNIFKGKITKIEKDDNKGAAIIHADIGGGITAYITIPSLKRLGLKTNSVAYFLVKAVSLPH